MTMKQFIFEYRDAKTFHKYRLPVMAYSESEAWCYLYYHAAESGHNICRERRIDNAAVNARLVKAAVVVMFAVYILSTWR